ncbi:MAG: DNA-3-methyladenine glycosylase [Armatimonadetes bacterium]|nr:DNA-3-methyladenine glycosylase [Armatimonadota bacterium]
MQAEPLPRQFYLRDPVTVARALLGCLLIHKVEGQPVGGVVVETEAYLGEGDPGSHASRGRTPRNEPMWEVGGTAYVYQVYGVHYCLNAVTGPAGVAQAVLVRALEPLYGIEFMRERRGRQTLRELASGPARLCQALAIDLALNRADLTAGPLFFVRQPEGGSAPGAVSPERIVTTTRIGLPVGRGDDLPLRFYLLGNPHVSRRDREAENRLLAADE